MSGLQERPASTAERGRGIDRMTIMHTPLLESATRYAAVDSPSTAVEQPWHVHAGDEVVVVLDGFAEVHCRTSGQPDIVRVEAGQRATVPARTEHRLVAQGLFESFLPAEDTWVPVAARTGEG